MTGPICKLAILAVTSRCSFHCRSCYAGKANRGDDLTEQSLKGIIGDLHDLGVRRLVISGGEPLLVPGLSLACLDLANNLGMRLTLTSSGLGMTPKVARKLSGMELARVQISLDGPDPSSNSLTRGDSFKQAVAAMRLGLRSGLNLSAMMVVHRGNLHLMVEWVDLLMDLGVTSATFDRFCSYTRETHDMELGPDELSRFHENYLFIRQRIKSVTLTCNDPVVYAKEFHDAAMPADWAAIPLGGCTAGLESIYVDASGMVYPCTKIRVAVGKVTRNSIREIWENSSVLKQLRDRQENLYCSNVCRHWRICGGCRAQAFERNGDLFSPDPACYLGPGERMEIASGV